MANFMNDEAKDGGLDWAVAQGDTLHLLSSDINGVYASIAAASLGSATIAGGLTLEDGTVDGRKTTCPATTVTPTGNGTVTHWAISNAGGSANAVVYSGGFSTGFAVTTGVNVAIAAFAAGTHRDPA